jgi:hypothetical protein
MDVAEDERIRTSKGKDWIPQGANPPLSPSKPVTAGRNHLNK